MYPNDIAINGNSFDDILFNNRNKEYGAYMLRKRQKRYLIIAFGISFMVVATTVITPFILNRNKVNPTNMISCSFGPVDMDSIVEFIPPKLPDINIESIKNTLVPPIVIEDADSTDANNFDPMADFVASIPNTALPSTPKVIVEEDPPFEVEEKPFLIVEVNATFEGGSLSDFNKWVANHIKYPQEAANNGLAGKVIVQFIINSNGNVEKATVLRGVDPLLDEEAVRVIESSPKWSAPIQGGRTVKQLFTLPVTFKLE